LLRTLTFEGTQTIGLADIEVALNIEKLLQNMSKCYKTWKKGEQRPYK